MLNRGKTDIIWKYLCLQIKRVFKAFFPIMLTTLILVSGIGILTGMIIRLNLQEENKQKVNIGIVGKVTDSYLGIGVQALQHLDSSRFTVNFEEMTEKEARESLEAGKLSAYVVIPEGFVESVVSGENMQIRYVTASGARGINSTLMDELVECVSIMITESQNAIYGMQHILIEEEKTQNFWEETNTMNIKYIKTVLNRTGIYDVQLLGYSNQLSFISFYVCGMIVLFFLLWGINGSYLLIKKDSALVRMLTSKNIPVSKQIAAEYSAYFLLVAASLLCVGVLLVIGMELTEITIPEWERVDLQEKLIFLIKLLPVAAVISAMHFFLYEMVSGIVSGVLLQFTIAIGLGYLSGCFYPISFFPETVQRFFQYLPTGVGVRYVGLSLTEGAAGKELLVMLIYMFIFLFMSGWIRKKKL